MPKKTHAHKVWEAIVELCDKTQTEYLTFRAKLSSTKYDDYKISTTNIEETKRIIQDKLVTIKKTSTRNWMGKK